MASIEPLEKQQPEAARAPFPAERKKTLRKGEQTRAWPQSRRRILGTALSLLGGMTWVWCSMYVDLGQLVWPVLLAVLLLAGACVALLFPFRWAVGAISLAFAFGELLTFYVELGFRTGWAWYAGAYGPLGPFWVLPGFLAALVGATVSYMIGRMRE